ncbi:MAG: cyanophycin synthetase family protein, partial [Planctomycetia bacterium]
MEFRKVLALRGPNLWARFPVLEAWVDLGTLKDSPSDEMPGFNERLMGWLPTMIEHRCSVGERGGFFVRLRRGTYLAHILEHVTLELQTLAGSDVGYGRARETSEEGVYKVTVEYEEEELARAALEAGRELCLAAVHDRPFDVAAEVARLTALAQRVRLGPSTNAIVQAAVQRGIPYRRLNTASLVQFGYGCKQRRIRAAETDLTGAIAQDVAQDKELTKSLLRSIGVPTPEGRVVESADDAWAAAESLRAPVVVKPLDGNQGRGVACNLTTREQVVAAFDAARKESPHILVEKFAPGHDYRLLVVGDKVVAAARRVPASGRMVYIRRNANLRTGGTAIDVTAAVHH